MKAKNNKNVDKRTAEQRAKAVEKMNETAQGRFLLEQAAVLWEEVVEAGDAAKHGEILDDMESAVMAGGRELLRVFLENAVAEKVKKLEAEELRICAKKDAEGKPCGGDLRHRGSKKKRF